LHKDIARRYSASAHASVTLTIASLPTCRLQFLQRPPELLLQLANVLLRSASAIGHTTASRLLAGREQYTVFLCLLRCHPVLRPFDFFLLLGNPPRLCRTSGFPR